MSSLLRFVPRSSLLLGLLAATFAFSAVAQADASPDFALELVRSIASQPAPPPSAAPARPSAGKARKRLHRTRITRTARAKAATPKLRLTAAQRGSGRVQILDAGDAGAGPRALPAVERKPSAGFAPGLIAARR